MYDTTLTECCAERPTSSLRPSGDVMLNRSGSTSSSYRVKIRKEAQGKGGPQVHFRGLICGTSKDRGRIG